MVHKSRQRKQKQQDINGTEIILLKGCTTEGVPNYIEKSSGMLHRDAVWNSLRSRRFLACRIYSPQLQIFQTPVIESFGINSFKNKFMPFM